MDKYRRKIAKQGQSGLTLIELVVTLALFSVIMLGVSVTFWQIMTVTAYSSNHIQAVRQVQNAGSWISRDGEQSQPEFVVTHAYDPAVDDIQEVLALGWYEMPYDPSAKVAQTVHYRIEKHELRRYLNDDTQHYAVIAQDIYAFEIPASGSYFELTITATAGSFRSASHTGIYTFKLRPGNPLG